MLINQAVSFFHYSKTDPLVVFCLAKFALTCSNRCIHVAKWHPWGQKRCLPDFWGTKKICFRWLASKNWERAFQKLKLTPGTITTNRSLILRVFHTQDVSVKSSCIETTQLKTSEISWWWLASGIGRPAQNTSIFVNFTGSPSSFGCGYQVISLTKG